MNSRDDNPDPDSTTISDHQPITWITEAADQISREAGLTRTPDIEDLVITVYLGLLDSPQHQDLREKKLLDRCRRQLIIWAWEQGKYDENLPVKPITTVRTGDQVA